MSDIHDKLYAYVEDSFQASGTTEWPTIRMAAKALRMSQRAVWDLAEDQPERFMLTSRFTDGVTMGDHFIETWKANP